LSALPNWYHTKQEWLVRDGIPLLPWLYALHEGRKYRYHGDVLQCRTLARKNRWHKMNAPELLEALRAGVAE